MLFKIITHQPCRPLNCYSKRCLLQPIKKICQEAKRLMAQKQCFTTYPALSEIEKDFELL